MERETSLPKIAVITTGGTIASIFDDTSKSIGISFKGEDLLNHMPDINLIAQIKLFDYSPLLSSNFNIDRVLEIIKRIRNLLFIDDIDGIVVVQGTDTLEETSYLAYLLCEPKKPIIFTGAMKSHNQPYADARGNLLAAIRTATSLGAKKQGVLVVMNQEIHSAREVVKSNSELVSAFKSPGLGPLGYVHEDKVIFYRRQILEEPLDVIHLQERVELIKCCLGMDNLLLKSCLQNKVNGIVLEGFGIGNIPEWLVEDIKSFIRKKIPVVLTSRSVEGRVLDLYGGPGGGKNLRKLGVIFAGRLNGPKARLKLMTALGANLKKDELRNYFEKEYD